MYLDPGASKKWTQRVVIGVANYSSTGDSRSESLSLDFMASSFKKVGLSVSPTHLFGFMLLLVTATAFIQLSRRKLLQRRHQYSSIPDLERR